MKCEGECELVFGFEYAAGKDGPSELVMAEEVIGEKSWGNRKLGWIHFFAF